MDACVLCGKPYARYLCPDYRDLPELITRVSDWPFKGLADPIKFEEIPTLPTCNEECARKLLTNHRRQIAEEKERRRIEGIRRALRWYSERTHRN